LAQVLFWETRRGVLVRIEPESELQKKNQVKWLQTDAFCQNQVSILRHLGINPVCPSQYPTGQIVHLLESGLPQEVHCLGAAHARTAVRDNFLAGVEFVYAVR
jgi:hypothetical protein